jgi:hypothetical protein
MPISNFIECNSAYLGNETRVPQLASYQPRKLRRKGTGRSLQSKRCNRSDRTARTSWCAGYVFPRFTCVEIIFVKCTPDAMIVSHFPHGPTVYFTLNNVSLRHDIGTYKDSTVSEQYPHLIFENFTSKLGERIQDVLKYLFPVPKEESKRVMTFANENDFISFR